jgi:predicted nucleic acid-binding protein
MNDKAFFDTNALVYVVGQRKERTAAAEALVVGNGVVSVQVLNELAAVASRKLGMTWDEIGEALAAIRDFRLCVTSRESKAPIPPRPTFKRIFGASMKSR